MLNANAPSRLASLNISVLHNWFDLSINGLTSPPKRDPLPALSAVWGESSVPIVSNDVDSLFDNSCRGFQGRERFGERNHRACTLQVSMTR